MIKRVIHRLLGARHFWRSADFGELAELYSSMLIRSMAIGMLAPFIGLYLLQHGFTLIQLLLFMITYFTMRFVYTIPSAFVIARIGPKHATLISNLVYVVGAVSLSLFPVFHLWALAAFVVFQAFGVTLFEICYTVDFSKVKQVEHAGKELGYMAIVQTIAAAASPLVGGLVAVVFGAQWTILAASFLALVAALPLFFTAEPVLTHQQIHFKGINWRAIWRGLVAQTAVGLDVQTSNTLWPMFIVVVIIGSTTGTTYAAVGALASLVVVGALLCSRFFGRVIDRHQGGTLLRISAIANSLLHVARGWVPSLPVASGVNIVNQLFTSGYNMPFLKGMFETADSLPGYRIVYLTLMEMALTLGMALTFVIALVVVSLLGTEAGFRAAFVIAGILTSLVMVHGFVALKRQ